MATVKWGDGITPPVRSQKRYNPELAIVALCVKGLRDGLDSGRDPWDMLDDLNEFFGLPRGMRNHGMSYQEMRDLIREVFERLGL